MRNVFVECKSRRTATRRCSWAAITVKVEGGYRCFESVADYKVWRQQK